MTPERFRKIHEVLGRRQPDLTVIADEVHKGRNIAAVLRTCDAVGIDQVYCVRPEAGYRPYRGTALGTQKWVSIRLCDRVDEPLAACKAAGMQIVVTSLDADAQDYWDPDYTRPTALVLGSERQGISDAAKQHADIKIRIPMAGMVESLNVSAACAIILAEAQRQRGEAKMYDESRLDPRIYRQRFFQWAHPAVAQYCDAHALAYPDVGDDGEIVEPAAWYRKIREMNGLEAEL